jgi:Lon protease-like protein
MSIQERRLPLFPLNVVLFPNSLLPLNVFEDRYKLMIQTCLDGDSLFGVVLIKSGGEVGEPAEPHSVGTVAQIVRVNRLDDGRLLLAVEGVERFRIVEITQQRPYLEAQIEVLKDDGEVNLPPTENDRIRDAVTRHLSLMLGLKGGWVREARMPRDPVALSYFIATLLQLDLTEKQTLLSERSTARRLETELRLLEREASGLRERVEQRMRQSFGRQ